MGRKAGECWGSVARRGAVAAAQCKGMLRPGPQRLSTNLKAFGRSVHSQIDEDGILEYLFVCLKPTNRFFVEIGVGPPWRNGGLLDIEQYGLECNCRLLAERGWTGRYIDGQRYPDRFDVKQEFITAENINQVLAKHDVPEAFDLFSLDIDSNDYWVWKALEFRPRVVVVEYNPNLAIDESKTIPYDPGFCWVDTKYYGASLLALKKLGDAKGYTLVYANGTNAFFVQTDQLVNADEFVYERIYCYRDVHKVHQGKTDWVLV